MKSAEKKEALNQFQEAVVRTKLDRLKKPNLLQRVLTYLFKKYCIPQHIFLPSMLIQRERSNIIYEVEANYYTKDFEPVIIIRPTNGTNLYSITGVELLFLKEYKGTI